MNIFLKSSSRIIARRNNFVRCSSGFGGRRPLSVDENLSLDIFRGFGIPVLKCGTISSVKDAKKYYQDNIGEGNDCVMLPTGRGDNDVSDGGVFMCNNSEDVEKVASRMLGQNEGLPCTKVIIKEKVPVRSEMYISIILCAASGPTFTVSPAGGTDIESVAKATPELIFKQPIDIKVGITDANTTFLATSLGFSPNTAAHREAKAIVDQLYKLFCEYSCTALEVNPLAESIDKGMFVCDGKINSKCKDRSGYHSTVALPPTPLHRNDAAIVYHDVNKGLPIPPVDVAAVRDPGGNLTILPPIPGAVSGISYIGYDSMVATHSSAAAHLYFMARGPCYTTRISGWLPGNTSISQDYGVQLSLTPEDKRNRRKGLPVSEKAHHYSFNVTTPMSITDVKRAVHDIAEAWCSTASGNTPKDVIKEANCVEAGYRPEPVPLSAPRDHELLTLTHALLDMQECVYNPLLYIELQQCRASIARSNTSAADYFEHADPRHLALAREALLRLEPSTDPFCMEARWRLASILSCFVGTPIILQERFDFEEYNDIDEFKFGLTMEDVSFPVFPSLGFTL